MTHTSTTATTPVDCLRSYARFINETRDHIVERARVFLSRYSEIDGLKIGLYEGRIDEAIELHVSLMILGTSQLLENETDGDDWFGEDIGNGYEWMVSLYRESTPEPYASGLVAVENSVTLWAWFTAVSFGPSHYITRKHVFWNDPDGYDKPDRLQFHEQALAECRKAGLIQ